jgi:hypothetical protein
MQSALVIFTPRAFAPAAAWKQHDLFTGCGGEAATTCEINAFAMLPQAKGKGVRTAQVVCMRTLVSGT